MHPNFIAGNVCEDFRTERFPPADLVRRGGKSFVGVVDAAFAALVTGLQFNWELIEILGLSFLIIRWLSVL